MLEDHLKIPVTIERLRTGPAAPYIDDFADWLHRLGFTQVTIDFKLRCLANWTDWTRNAGFSADNILEGFEAGKTALKEDQRKPYSRDLNKSAIVAATTYIRFLREKGNIARPPALPSPHDTWPVLGEFRSWMRQHRGLQETTLDLYEFTLVGLVGSLGDATQTYTAKAIRDFVLSRAKPHGISRAQAIAVAVRSFLRFLGTTGRCPVGLVHAVPRYSSYQLQSVPKYLEPLDVQRVIAGCVSDDANGLRDRAVILLLTRFGLRASEVAGLSFKDFDWKNGRVAVCGKSRRQEWLPLPQDVGNAVIRYIKEGRPPIKTDRVFTKVDAPLGPLTRASVTHIARSALRRAGIKAPINGAHVFRHSAATAMLRAGVSLHGVSTVLRHRNLSTTGIYSKVDFGLLSEVAGEWPEVASC